MNKSLKWYDILNTKQEFFTPTIDVAKDGIVTVSNLQTLRVGSIVKFKTEEAYFGLVSTINANGKTSGILTLVYNEIFQGPNLTTIAIDFTLLMICIMFIISCCLFYIFQKLDSKIKFFQNSNNSNGSTSPEGGDKKPSGDGKPDPKSDDNDLLALILRFLYEHKKEILIGVGVGSFFIGIGFVIYQFGGVPALSDVISKLFNGGNTPTEEVELPTTEEYIFPFENMDLSSEVGNLASDVIAQTNSILVSALQEPRFQLEPIPDYFNNLVVTEFNFTAGMAGFPSYAAYKEALLSNFLTLYTGIDRNLLDITMLKPGILNSYTIDGINLRDLYVFLMQGLDEQVASEVIKVQIEIVQGVFQEELFLVSKPHLLPVINDLLHLLQSAIQAQPPAAI